MDITIKRWKWSGDRSYIEKRQQFYYALYHRVEPTVPERPPSRCSVMPQNRRDGLEAFRKVLRGSEAHCHEATAYGSRVLSKNLNLIMSTIFSFMSLLEITKELSGGNKDPWVMNYDGDLLIYQGFHSAPIYHCCIFEKKMSVIQHPYFCIHYRGQNNFSSCSIVTNRH